MNILFKTQWPLWISTFEPFNYDLITITKLNQISSLRSDQKRNKTDKFLQKLSAQQILRV